MVNKIVSGGQTGVDRAALDVARTLGIPCGGWCPRGRRAEDGVIDASYPLKETPTDAYPQRTEWNVRDSDATLILGWGELTEGSAYTRTMALRWQRPVRVVDLLQPEPPEATAVWITGLPLQGSLVLNVAGPRGSRHPDIYASAYRWLWELFAGAGAGR